MKQLFLGLALADVLVLGGAAVLGWMTHGSTRLFVFHFGLGLFGAIYTVFIHVVAFVYFIVCRKIVLEAVERANLDPSLSQRADVLKSWTFRYAMLGIITVIATAILGARIAAVAAGVPDDPASTRRAAAVTVHLVCAIIMLIAHLIVLTMEYHNIEAQAELTREALAALDDSRSAQRGSQS